MAYIHNRVQLYYDPRYIFINIAMPGVANWNMPMNETRFKISKGTFNLVQFIVRDNDRKPINLRGKKLHITINNENQVRTLAHKKLKVIDYDQAIVHLEMEPFETLDWPLGYLEFNITITEEKSVRLLSLDESQNARGFIEVVEGVYSGPRPSLESCVFHSRKVNDMPDTYRYFSDVFPGTLNTSSYSGVNTAAVTLENYTGRLWVLGCLEQSIPENTDDFWFYIPVGEDNPWIDFNNATGITQLNFISRCYWIMFKFDPSVDVLADPGQFSAIKKISFRN